MVSLAGLTVAGRRSTILGMTILVYHHAASMLHDTGPHHPERPRRIEAVLAGARRVPGIEERPAPMAAIGDLVSLHAADYVEAVAAFCEAGGGMLDPDTAAGPGSWEAALRSVGAGLAAIEAIEAGEARAAFLAVRPPGHHALRERAMGCCLFNNAAITADRLAAGGARVAIVDWDVHHGNGTQNLFYERDDVLYVSIHEFPFYPGTGWVEEVGGGSGRGFTVNVPVPAGAGGTLYATAFDRIVDPVLDDFAPDWVVVSAGFDAHRADPMAGLVLEADDYGWMTARIAARGVPVVAYLEGGYDIEALEDSVEATLLGVGGGDFDVSGPKPSAMALRMVDEAASAASSSWKSVQAD
jgi:acetoin utilization deacetylase AcuC-like enzyme